MSVANFVVVFDRSTEVPLAALQFPVKAPKKAEALGALRLRGYRLQMVRGRPHWESDKPDGKGATVKGGGKELLLDDGVFLKEAPEDLKQVMREVHPAAMEM